MNTLRLLTKFKRQATRYQHYFMPAGILVLTLTLTYTFLTLFTIPRAPRLKPGSGNTLYSASNQIFSVGIGTKDGTPQINFARGNAGASFILAGSAKVKPTKSDNHTLTFPSVQPGIDLVYTTLVNGLKEEIIIHSASNLTSNVFLFDFALNNAVGKTLTTGFLDPTFRDQEGNYLFHFEKPFALDEGGSRTDNVLLQIMEDKQLPGKYSLKLIVDEVWLNDPARIYPIRVDPTIVHDTTSEFATGTFNRVFDAGSGSNPRLESYYQELPADEFTVGLWHLNEASGNALDSSGNGYTGTPTGTSVVSGLLGNARYFSSGSYSDYIEISDSPALRIATGITVEAWFKIPSIPSSNTSIIRKDTETGTRYLYGILINTSGQVNAQYFNGTNFLVTSTESVADNSWHHVASVISGTTISLYLDGVWRGSTSITGTQGVPTGRLNIGANPPYTSGGGTSGLISTIDEVRISNVARTPEEIKVSASRRPYSVYTSEVLDLGGANSFTTAWNDFSWTELGVTTGAGETLYDSTSLVAQWNFNETSGTTATNNAGSCGASCNGTLTSFASTSSQDQAVNTGWTANNRRWGAGGIMFDGTDDHVSAETIADLKFTGDFSLEAWVQPAGSTVGQIVSNGAAGDWLYLLGGSTATSPICKIYQANSGSGYLQADGKTPIVDGKWHHVVCTLSGNTLSVYIDGKLDAQSSTTAGTRDVSSAGTFTIGRFTNATSSYYAGNMDSFRAYSRALTSAEILSNYQAGQIELQTRVGNTASPEDGSWEAWTPISGETQINNLDTADDSLVSYWPFEEYNVSTTYDRIGSNHGTVTGAAQMISRHTRAYNFTDGNDYITIADHSSLDITGDFTLMAWVYRTGGSNGYVISKFNTNGGGGYALLHGNSGEVYCRTDNGTSYTDSYTTTGHVTTSTGWTHITAVRSGSSCQVYINGTNQTSVSNSHSTVTANAQPFKIGANASDNSSPFYGYIDEVRVFNDDLSQAEILHYMGSSTAYDQLKNSRDAVIKLEGNASLKLETGALKVDPNTIALWQMEETGGSGAYLKDSSSNANHITPTGTTSVNGITGKGRNFNGTSDYMYSSTSMAIPTGDFTYEAWIRPDTVNDEMIFMASDGTGANEFFVFLTSTDKVQVVTNGTARLTTTTGIKAQQWQHLVITRSGATITAYIDGIADATTGTDAGAMAFGACGLLIGTDADSGCDGTLGNWFDGIIDDVRVSNIAKNAIEINEIYRAGRDQYFNSHMTSTDLTGKTTLPFYVAADRPGTYLQASLGETPFSLGQPDGNTVGLWRLDEKNGISNYIRDSSGSSNNGTPTGTTYSEGKIGKSRQFNGTSDRITIPASSTSGLNIVGNAVTTSAWVYPTALAGTQFIVARWVSYGMYTDSAGKVHCGGVKLSNWTGNTTLITNTWYYLTCVTNGANSKLYINGVLDSTGTLTAQSSNSNDVIIGGRYNGTSLVYDAFFPGIIDEVSISNTERTADEIRSAYEYGMGLRTHPITIDFAADLDSGNLIADSNDLSFTIDATVYGLNAKGSMLFPGDKIIVKENYDGTQYQAQGTVTGVTASTGAVTISSWDSGSTFPSGGYTAASSVFKWQREYWNHRGEVLDSHLDGLTQLSLRLTDGAEGRTIYLDDLRSSSGYMTNPASSTITSGLGDRYFQYRAVLSSSDTIVSPQLSMVTVDYDINVAPNTPSLDAPVGDPAYGGMLAYCDDSTDVIKYRILDSSGNWGTAANAADIDGSTTDRRCERAQIYANPDNSEKVLLSLHNDATTTYIYGQVWDGNSWGNVQFLASPPFSSFSSQKLDGAYLADGTFMAFYADSTTTPKFAIWDSNSWSSVGNSTQDIGHNPIVIIAHARPGTNEVMTVIHDNGSDAETIYYDGTGTATTDFTLTQLASSGASSNGYHIDFAWSQNNPLRGAFVYTNATSDTSPVINIFTADGSGGGSWGTPAENQTLANALGAQQIVDRPGTHEFLTCNDDTVANVTCFEERDNDTTPTLQTTTNGTLATATETDDDTHSFDLGYEQQSGDLAIAVYSDNTTTPKLKTYNPSTDTWDSSATNMTTQSSIVKSVDIYPDPNSNDIMILTRDTGRDLHTTVWDGTNNQLYSSGDRANVEQSEECGLTTDAHCASFAWNLHGSIVATNQPLTPTFQTTATDDDSDYIRYRIEVCENVGMTVGCQTYDQTSSQTGWSGQNAQTSTAYTSGTQATYTVQTPLSAGTTYYWRSSAIDPAGTNTWGSTQVTPYSFTTTTAPSAPTTPWAEGATNPSGIIDLTPEFSAIHNDSDGDPAVYYEIEVNTASDFTGTVMWDSGSTAMASLADGVRSSDVSYAGSALSWGTTYYWRIRFTDDLGAVGAWSATQNFTTNSSATPTTITSPLDGAIKVGLTPTITLSSTDSDSDYLRYRIQICEDFAMTVNCQTFDQTVSQTGWSGQDAETSTAYASGTTASYTLLSNLAPNTPYYLHAGAIDPAGTNTWTSYSSVLSFTTRALNEGFHCLIEETATDTSLTITWTDRETNEDNYILQRNLNGGGFSLYQTLAADTTSYQDTSISQGNTYQYRIAPYTIAGDATGEWCTTNTLSLESGLFNFSGLNFSGLNLN